MVLVVAMGVRGTERERRREPRPLAPASSPSRSLGVSAAHSVAGSARAVAVSALSVDPSWPLVPRGLVALLLFLLHMSAARQRRN